MHNYGPAPVNGVSTTIASGGNGPRLCFGGDFSLGDRYLKRWQQRHPDQPHYTRLLQRPESFLTEVRHFFEPGRTAILNLETVLTEARESPFEGQKGFIGCDHPARTTGVLKALGVWAVSLANNHSKDFGEEGLVETMHHLAASDIRFFGAGTTAGSAHPLVLEERSDAPIYVLGSMQYRRRYARDYAYFASKQRIGVDSFDECSMARRIARIRKDATAGRIVVYPHWGANYAMHTPAMRAMAEQWIDAGANLIIGHGSHTLQGIESIKGVPVCYSIGNFIFNAPGRYAQFDCAPYSAITHVDFSLQGPLSLRVYPIVTDNRSTHFQVRPVDEYEARDCGQRIVADGLSLQRDGLGWHFALTSN